MDNVTLRANEHRGDAARGTPALAREVLDVGVVYGADIFLHVFSIVVNE